MKIAVLMGSPRRKDSYEICRQIESNCQSKEIDFEYIYLNGYEIESCRGCDLCFQKGEHLCPCHDDRSAILDKLRQADGIIFASPVYAYQIPAPLKRVIDRLSYLFHRQELVEKPVFLIVTSGGGGHKQVMKYLQMIVAGWGCHLIGKISIVSPLYFNRPNSDSILGYREKYSTKMEKKLKKEAVKFIQRVENQELDKPSYYNVFMFNCLKSKTLISNLDFVYWEEKGWLNAEYFYTTKLSLTKRVFGRLVWFMIRQLCKTMS